MRICGTILLIGGCLLCASIAWAAIGFLMMSLGLICFLIAEEKAKRGKAKAVRSADPDQRQEPVLPLPAIVPPAVSSLPTDAPQKPAPIAEGTDARQMEASYISRRERLFHRRAKNDVRDYDAESWRSVVTNDPDIARSVEVLVPFGRKYVDQLATAYLVFGEKSYLPILLKMVVATIKKDTGRDLLSPLEDRDPGMDLNSGTAASAPASTVDNFAPAELESSQTNQVHSRSAGSPAAKTSMSKLEQTGYQAQGRTTPAPKQPLPDQPLAGSPARSVDIGRAKPNVARPFNADEAGDLAELLKKIS